MNLLGWFSAGLLLVSACDVATGRDALAAFEAGMAIVIVALA